MSSYFMKPWDVLSPIFIQHGAIYGSPSSSCGHAIGNKHFKDEFEKLTGRRQKPLKAGVRIGSRRIRGKLTFKSFSIHVFLH
jgi:hypothetical protein